MTTENFNNKVYFNALEEMNRRFPQKELGYRNDIVASILAKGKKEKLTENWLMRALLGDVEDEFMTYGQAVYIKDEYFKGIIEVAKMF